MDAGLPLAAYVGKVLQEVVMSPIIAQDEILVSKLRKPRYNLPALIIY